VLVVKAAAPPPACRWPSCLPCGCSSVPPGGHGGGAAPAGLVRQAGGRPTVIDGARVVPGTCWW
jgi:hypothetical protein